MIWVVNISGEYDIWVIHWAHFINGFWSSSSFSLESKYRIIGKLEVPKNSNTTAKISKTFGQVCKIVCSNVTETLNLIYNNYINTRPSRWEIGCQMEVHTQLHAVAWNSPILKCGIRAGKYPWVLRVNGLVMDKFLLYQYFVQSMQVLVRYI